MKIFLDDVCLCPCGWKQAKTYKEFIDLIEKNKNNIELVSLDYDLSFSDKNLNGIDVCEFLIENNIKCNKIIIHSTHPKIDLMYKMLSKKYENIIIKEYNFYEVENSYSQNQ